MDDLSYQLYSLSPKSGDIVVMEVDTSKNDFNQAVSIYQELAKLIEMMNVGGVVTMLLPSGMDLKILSVDELIKLRNSINEVILWATQK